MNKKNLLIVTSTFPSGNDDIVSARFVFDLAKALTGNYKVHALTPHSYGAGQLEDMEGVITHRFCYFLPKRLQWLTTGDGILANIKKNRFLLFQLPFLFCSELLHIIKTVKRERIEIVNTHWIMPQGFALALLKKFLNVKHILTIHSAGIFTLKRWGAFGKHIARFIIRRTDMVMPVSSYIKATLDELVGVDYNFKISPMGVDLKRFDKTATEGALLKGQDIDNGINLLFVGKMVEKKGLKHLLDAASLLKQSGQRFKLNIVGGGPYEEEHKRYAANLNLNNDVCFLHWIANEKLPEVYQLSDIVVVPSVFDKKGETEGMPVVILEALAMSRPVLASQISGIPDIIKDGYNGWLINPGDPDKLKERIAEISKIDLQKYKENAYKTAKKYDLGKIASIYRDAVEGM